MRDLYAVRFRLIGRRTTAPHRLPDGAPSIAAIALWGPSGGNRVRLLTAEQREELAAVSTFVRFRRGMTLYQEGDRADAVFNLTNGVVKSCKKLDGAEHIVAFLFPGDLVGLAEEGTYTNSAEAASAVTGYRIPAAALETMNRQDPALEFHVIVKLCHELREAQRHAFLLSKRSRPSQNCVIPADAGGLPEVYGDRWQEIYIPMSRSDIAAYVSMSLEAVSRSFRTLVGRGAIAFRDRRHARILSHSQLEGLAAQSDGSGSPPRAADGA